MSLSLSLYTYIYMATCLNYYIREIGAEQVHVTKQVLKPHIYMRHRPRRRSESSESHICMRRTPGALPTKECRICIGRTPRRTPFISSYFRELRDARLHLNWVVKPPFLVCMSRQPPQPSF